MYFMIYVSSAVESFSDTDLVKLLETSRKNNTATGITGMLVYKDGNFMQVLEGEKEAVRSLFEKIGRDTRHRGELVLLDGDIEEREFPDWSMGFKNLDSIEADKISGYNEFLNSALTGEEFQSNPSKSQELLLSFKKNMR